MMNITTEELNVLKCLLTSQDKKEVAEEVNKSKRLINAVIWGDRVNDEIELLLYRRITANLQKVCRTYVEVKRKNKKR